MILLLLAFLQWTSYADRKMQNVVLNGAWVSCPEGDEYTEKAFEYKTGERVLWSLHMGPRDEFALFGGPVPPEHVEHGSPLNKLGPAFHYEDGAGRTGRNWSAFGAHLNVIRVPGSYDDCYAFFVTVTQDKLPTWAAK